LPFLRNFLQKNLPLSVKLFLKEWLAIAMRGSSHKGLTRGEPSLSKDQPAILVCDERIPSPDRDAGSARMFLILKALAKSNRVVFLAFNRPHGIEYEQALWDIGIETGDAVDYRRLIKQRGFAAAILSRPAIAGAMLRPVRRADPKLKIIYDMLDVHHLRSAREAALTGDSRAARESEKLRRLETRLARGADFIWCGSSPDQKLMSRIAPGVPSVVVPTVHRLHGRGPTFGEREQLLFVGNFSHRPNGDAVHFLAREILPLIRKCLPGIELLVVGDNAPPEFAEYASSGVRLLGYVPDLDPIIAGCRVFVAPIRFGSGVNGKIGEALSYGLPVVTNTIGAEGWDFTDGKQVLIADAPDDFAAAVVRLYGNAELWQTLSDNGYRHIAENYTPEVIGQVINESVRRAVRRTKRLAASE
jgi:glycosyltransferase involved in cell wall biosynthesis